MSSYSSRVRQFIWRQAVRYAPLWLLGSLVLTVLVAPAFPPDDLLRHVVSYAWRYSHTAMYPFSSLPEYNMYPAFDRLAGALAQIIGTTLAAKALVTAAYACGIFAIWDALAYWKGAFRLSPVHLTAVTLLILLAGASNRLWLGRPEAWALCWAVFATTAGKSRARQLATGLLGLALSTGYWMAPLFYAPILSSRLPLKRALLLIALLSISHLGFWAWWSAGDVWHWPAMLSAWKTNRLFPVIETESIAQAVWQPASLAMFLLAIKGLNSVRGSWRVVSAHASYWLLNLIRLLPVSLVCLFPLIVKGAASLRLPLKGALVAAVCLYLLVVNQLHTGIQLSTVPLFKLPKGALVLTPFSSGVYSLPFANPGTVQVIPAIELGATPRELQRLSRAIDDFSLTCNDLATHAITHVVENRAKGVPPSCLRLIQTEGAWRLWAVKTR